MTTAATIRAALEAQIPALKEEYKTWTRARLAAAVEKLGPYLKNIGNDWAWAKAWNNSLRGVVDRKASGIDLQPATINEERLEAAAQAHAVATVEEVIVKLNQKLQELDGMAHIRIEGGFEFVVIGERAGHRVAVHQSRIVNVSPKGTLFNQYPALIYVDDKKTSAAAYKKMFA